MVLGRIFIDYLSEFINYFNMETIMQYANQFQIRQSVKIPKCYWPTGIVHVHNLHNLWNLFLKTPQWTITCIERPLVVNPSPIWQCLLNLQWETTCFERPLFGGILGSTSRKVFLYTNLYTDLLQVGNTVFRRINTPGLRQKTNPYLRLISMKLTVWTPEYLKCS